jgi:hypothetical protein
MICERCDGKIKSGKVEKIIMGGVTICYCKHCFQAVLRDA